jgi:PAS domain S-box-containing protein
MLAGVLPAVHPAEGDALSTDGETLTAAAQVRALSPEQAARGPAVRLNGVVTFSDVEAGLLFFHDGTGGVFLALREPAAMPAGTRVEVTGIAQLGSHLPYVAQAGVVDRGVMAFPAPHAVSFDQLATGAEDSNWIQTEGVVRSYQVSKDQARLVLVANGKRILARVRELSEASWDPVDLVDAEVRIQGVSGAPATGSSEGILLDVLIPHPRFVETRVRGVSPFQLPVRTTSWLRQASFTNALVHRVRIQGILETESGMPMRLRDREGVVSLSTASLTTRIATNATVEVVGFPGGDRDNPRLEDVRVSMLSLQRSAQSATNAQTTSSPQNVFLPVLHEIDEVRRLSREEAEKGYPVRLKGIITFAHVMENGLYILFLQDATAGIFVQDDSPEPALFQPGGVVDLEGTTDRGGFSPVVRKTKMTLQGEAPLPTARASTVEELLTGRKDSQRVRVRGVIVREERDGATVRMGLLAGGTLIDVFVPLGAGIKPEDNLSDAAVRMDGVCAVRWNEKNQLTGLALHVRRWEDVQLIEPAPADLFASPPRSIRSLFQFDLTKDSGRRQHVRGTVSLHLPGQGVFIQDQSDGLFIPAKLERPFEPGEEVQAVFYLRVGEMGAAILEPRFRASGVRTNLLAEPLTPRALELEDLNNRYVVVEARVLEHRKGTNQTLMVCQVGDRLFEVLAAHPSLKGVVQSFRVGSVLQLRGVWAAQGGGFLRAEGAGLWLGSGKDVKLIDSPPWWATRYAAAVGGGMLVIVLGALIWVNVLRRQVGERTAQSQQALALLQAAMAQSPSGIVVADAKDGAIRLANPAALRLRKQQGVGRSGNPAESQYSDWHILHPDGTEYPWQQQPLFRALSKGELTRDEEVILRDSEGRDLWVEVNAAPILDPQGTITSGILVLHDVTGRKQSEQVRQCVAHISEVALSARTLEELYPQIHSIVGQVIPAPNFFVALKGGQEDLIDFPYYSDEKDPPSPSRKAGAGLTEYVLRLGAPVLVTAEQIEAWKSEGRVTASGTIPSCWLGVPLRTQEQTIGIMAVQSYSNTIHFGDREKDLLVLMSYPVANAIERKRVDVELQESQEKFSRAFHLSPDAINLNRMDDGVYLDVNEGFTRLSGYTREEAVGQSSLSESISLWVNPEDRRRLVAGLRDQGEVTGLEADFRCKDGRIVTGLMSARILTIQGVRCILSITRDITERKRAEEERERLQAQLLQAQKMESIGRLAGGVAHDFNNMLQAILGNVALAAEETPSSNPIWEHLVEIQKAAERSAALTRQLLAFARKQTVSPKLLDLNDTVAGMLKMLHRLVGENIQLAWLPGSNLWPVKMDPSQVDQVLANLIVNARDAVRDGGRISIQTHNVTVDNSQARANAEWTPGKFVQLSVIDTGCGMDPTTKAHLFEPFFTTKPAGKGTGLGLATVYGIVKQNGGFLGVRTELGRGTTFQIYLPRAESSSLPVEESVRAGLPRGTETILLVEDEPQVLVLGQRILRQYGYHVLAAELPEVAIQLADSFSGPIHLLVTDVVMPGMNGRELSKRLVEIKPGLKCLYMSGYTADVVAHEGVLEEGVQLLQKPFTIEALTQRVREVLETS